METPAQQDQLKNFEAYRSALDRFIGFKDVDLVIDEDAETCYFAPGEKKVAISGRWFKEKEAAKDKAFEELKIKFGIFHEFSHYRDMIKEADRTGNESMLSTLKSIGKRVIEIEDGGKKKKLRIGGIIHDLYNCIDDIVVNTEVGNYNHAEITRGDMKSVYQRYLFADYKKDEEEKGKDKDKSKEEKPKELNLDGPVDYSKRAPYKAFPYYFLRKHMVTDQEIILPDVVKSILEESDGRSVSWNTSIRKLRKIFADKIEASKGNPRFAGLEESLVRQLGALDVILSQEKTKQINKMLKTALLDPLKPGTELHLSSGRKVKIGKDTIISGILSLEDIVELFTITKGQDFDHRLVVTPDKRYEIIGKIFEPIIVTFILMTLLDEDLPKNKDKKGKKGGGEGGGKGKKTGGGGGGGEGWDDEGDDEGDEEGDEEGDDVGGDGELRRKIDDLGKIIDYKKQKEAEEKKKAEAKKTNKSLGDILKSHGFSEDDAKNAIKALNKVIGNFKGEILEYTEMLKEELKQLELDYKKEIVLARKGKRANYDAVRKQLGKHYDDMDITGERIWEKKKFQEALQQEFKKLVFYFMLDVSGSTKNLRGDNGALNGTAIALAVALHNVEKDIRDLIGDPNYRIPINFIVYADGANLINCRFNSFDEMLAEANYDIVSLGGGTSDATGWSKSADVILKDFDDNGTYVEDIEKGDMKAFVLQIADTDITEDGVLELKRKVMRKFGDKGEQMLNGIERKRLIIGEKREEKRALTEEEYRQMQGRGEFSPVILTDKKTGKELRDKDGKLLVKINEVYARRKSDIKDSVKKLFENLFADVLKNKK